MRVVPSGSLFLFSTRDAAKEQRGFGKRGISATSGERSDDDVVAVALRPCVVRGELANHPSHRRPELARRWPAFGGAVHRRHRRSVWVERCTAGSHRGWPGELGPGVVAGRVRNLHFLRLPLHRGCSRDVRLLCDGSAHPRRLGCSARRLDPGTSRNRRRDLSCRDRGPGQWLGPHRDGDGCAAARGDWSGLGSLHRRWRTRSDSRVATTGHFLVLAAVFALPATAGLLGGLHVTAAGLAWATAMGAVTTAFAYVAWYACQRSLSGTTAGAVQLVIPVLTAVGAILLLGEQLSIRLIVCAALVGTGTWLGRPSANRA